MPCAVFSFKGTARKKNIVTMHMNKLKLEKWSNGETLTNRSYLQKYAGRAWMTMAGSVYTRTELDREVLVELAYLHSLADPERR